MGFVVEAGGRRNRGPREADGGELTPLVYAARSGSIDAARVLLDAGADVNQVTRYGWSPLLAATQNRNYQLGKFLIEHGADVNIANKGGWTPLYLATDNRNLEGGDYPTRTADMDDLEYITLLLDTGANLNAAVDREHGDAHGVHQSVARRRRGDCVPARLAVRRRRAACGCCSSAAPIRRSIRSSA